MGKAVSLINFRIVFQFDPDVPPSNQLWFAEKSPFDLELHLVPAPFNRVYPDHFNLNNFHMGPIGLIAWAKRARTEARTEVAGLDC